MSPPDPRFAALANPEYAQGHGHMSRGPHSHDEDDESHGELRSEEESGEGSGSEDDEDAHDGATGVGEGMDPSGFAGPSQKVVKPLTPEALAAFKAAQERAGVVYISRIPPGMRPTKVRHLMSAYGEVGRVYLQQEGMSAMFAVDLGCAHA